MAAEKVKTKRKAATALVQAPVPTTDVAGFQQPVLQQMVGRTPMDLATKDQAIRALMNSLNSEQKKVLVYADEAPNPYILRRPTGLMELDIDLAGGWPAGGCCIVSGPDNCLDGSTHIHHEVRRPDGTRITHKWVTLERLYQRFHGAKVDGRGKNQEKSLTGKTGVYSVPSMNDDGGIIQNRVLDVVCTGENECYELRTAGGYRITGTAAHKFFDGEKFVVMASLKKGDIVYVHNNTRREAEEGSPAKQSRKFFYVKYHPVASVKTVHDRKTGKDYKYHVLPRSRAVVEAHMNGLHLDLFLERLNAKATHGLSFLPESSIVHHEDENVSNDAWDNLLVTTRAGHMREHLKDAKRDNYFRFMAVEDMVVAMRYVGRRVTYDLKMNGPFHNYVASNFVVHNSGKTRLLLESMAMQQKLYGQACRMALAIVEGGFPFDQAKDAGLKISLPDSMIMQYQQLRVERGLPPLTNEEVLANYKQSVGQLILIRGETGEEILGNILKCIKTNAFSFIGCDSINGLLPVADAAKELEKNPKKAAQAFLVDNFFKHYIAPMTTGVRGVNETTLIFTQQVRANQERANAPAHLQQYIKVWALGGSWAAKHFKLIDLTVSDGKILRQGKNEEGERGSIIGKTMTWVTEKGKAGTHDNKHGEVAYYYGINRFDTIGEIIVSGMKHGAIQQVGRKWCVCRPQTGEVLPAFTAPSQKALRSMIEADFEFELAVRREILASAGVQCLYR